MNFSYIQLIKNIFLNVYDVNIQYDNLCNRYKYPDGNNLNVAHVWGKIDNFGLFKAFFCYIDITSSLTAWNSFKTGPVLLHMRATLNEILPNKSTLVSYLFITFMFYL